VPGFLPSICTRLLLGWICLSWLGLIGTGWNRVDGGLGESTRTIRNTSGQEGNGGLMMESFGYDEAWNRVLVMDGLGQATRMSYDGMGRLPVTKKQFIYHCRFTPLLHLARLSPLGSYSASGSRSGSPFWQKVCTTEWHRGCPQR
jgi:hypothetical protein